MKLLVTGATGFLGRHVLTRLGREQAVSVSVLAQPGDVFTTGVEKIVGRIGSDAPDWDALGRPDTIIHLAWGGLPNYRSVKHLDEAHRHSAFLRGLAHQGLSRIVCAGTCYEYGMIEGSLTEDRLTDPANPYGLGKDILRRELQMDAANASLLWGRFFYLYGEGQAPTSLFSQVRSAIVRREPFFAMSGGEQLRDFLPIGLAVDHLVRLALDPAHTGIYNIASGAPVSIRRLVESWFADAEHDVALDLGRYPYPDWEPFAFWGDTTKLSAAIDLA